MRNRFVVLQLILALTPVLLSSCTGVRVIKNPSESDKGIRYYRPKPYLLLAPAQEGEHNGQNVSIKLEYLPDFGEEYSIHIRTGINGTVSANITLDQGWNLTGLDVEADPNTDDLISAVADAASKFTAGGGGDEARFIVQASNVPLGYYEAVIGKDPTCKKQLYGWRYVGFLPYRRCPVDGRGMEQPFCCESDSLFGLVWENGALTFKEIGQIHERAWAPGASRTDVQTVPVDN